VSRRVRVGLAGLGRMGRIHAANLSGRCATAELAAVFDADAGAARQASEQFGVPAAGSFAGLLADPAIDAVAIAVPTAAHAGLCIEAARAGKHVFCEKPVSLDRAETVRIDQPQYRHYEWRTPGWASRGLSRDFEQRYPEAYALELDGFARCVRDSLPPRVTAYDALAAFDLSRAADQSWRSGATVKVTAQRTRAGVVYQVPDGTGG
jgi:predicted dehydrogenase